MPAQRNNSLSEKIDLIPYAYDRNDSHASALRLVYQLEPQWETTEGEVKFVHFTEGITNTVRPSNKSQV